VSDLCPPPLCACRRFKLSLYSQKEVINARMLGNFVPDECRNIIQMNGTTRYEAELAWFGRHTKLLLLLC